MNKLFVLEIVFVIISLVLLLIALLFFAIDQELSFRVFVTGMWAVMFSITVSVLRKQREERDREKLLRKFPHVRAYFE